MRILVLSDSHAGLSFMRRCVEKTKPDAIVHLGDYFDDAHVLSEEYPHIPIHAVPGNCDKYRLLRSVPEILCYDVIPRMRCCTLNRRCGNRLIARCARRRSLLCIPDRKQRGCCLLSGAGTRGKNAYTLQWLK